MKNARTLVQYMRAKLRSAVTYNSLKLVLIGREAMGKTTLMHRLQGDTKYNSLKATNGMYVMNYI